MTIRNLIRRSTSLLLIGIALLTLALVFVKQSNAAACTIAFNEIFPDPIGTDTSNEWIELYNCSDNSINLTGTVIKDKSGAKQTLKDIIIQPKEFQVIYTTISLNQTNEELYLYNVNGQLIDSFSYASSKEGLSWARATDGDGEWMSEQNPTPGDKNIFMDTSDCFYNAKSISITEARVQQTDSDEKVQLTGIVTTMPGQIYQSKIYIQDDNAGILVSLPTDEIEGDNLQIGSKITVAGMASTYYNEPEIIVNKLQCLKSGNVEIAPITANSISLNQNALEQNAGKLIHVKGIISKTSGNTLWFDLPGLEVKVSIPKSITGISKSKGDAAEITGVLSVNSNSIEEGTYKIIPRSIEDIIIHKRVQVKKNTTKATTKTLTNKTQTTRKATNQQNRSNQQLEIQQSLKKPIFKKYNIKGKKLAVKREVISYNSDLSQIKTFASGSGFITSLSTIFLVFRRK